MSIDISERAVLSILIRKPDNAAKAFARVPIEQFNGPNRLVVEAIQALRVARRPVAADTVATEMRRRGTLNRVGDDLPYRLDGEFISASTLDYHLDILVDAARKHSLSKIGHSLLTQAEAPDADSTQLAHSAAEQIQAVIDRAEAEQDVQVETLRDLLDSPDEPYDWIVPGLLERMDRLILTGIEGMGKSTLFRQMAVAIAAGVHPFTLRDIEPRRVLYLDLENSRRQARRKLRPMAIAAQQAGKNPYDNLFIECRPEGIDVTSPEHEMWFVQRAVALQPSILFTGPIYKMHEDDPNDERPARQIAAVLDRVRAAANCAIVIETHSGHGTEGLHGPRKVRPNGTSMWLRWPEFGYGLRPTDEFTKDNRLVEFVPWRGDRDERDWPARLRTGGTWPWQVATDPNAQWTPHPTPTQESA